MQLSLLQGFGINQYTGNKALIITEHELNAKQKQGFARKQNLPVCIFVDDDSAGNFTVDFYYPHRQSPMCLHGSLAAAKMYFKIYPTTIAQIKAAAGIKINARQINEEQITLSVIPEIINKSLPSLYEVSEMLNLAPSYIQDIAIASVGSIKLLVKLTEIEQLLKCKPSLTKITSWGKGRGINGIYAYYKEDSNITGRNFNHLNAELEDSATGVAAGALTLYYQQSLIVNQGINLNNHCQILTEYSKDLIYLTGNIYFIA
ncbi:MAG: PhzF family phenazine biosynthesis protein [Neisseriaceae bacterium]|nr:MAG: PhzF family phenazine biosynthesis protein [Neisseriaceae bacterium]